MAWITSREIKKILYSVIAWKQEYQFPEDGNRTFTSNRSTRRPWATIRFAACPDHTCEPYNEQYHSLRETERSGSPELGLTLRGSIVRKTAVWVSDLFQASVSAALWLSKHDLLSVTQACAERMLSTSTPPFHHLCILQEICKPSD